MSFRRNLAKRLAAIGVASAAAISGGFLIAPYEGRVVNKDGLHTVYKDPIGIPTACYGQTGKDLYGRQIQMGMTYTEDECVKMLATTLNNFEKELDKLTNNNYSSDWQKAALLSFAYNAGLGNFRTSTLRKHLLEGRHEEACDQLVRWVYANKQLLQGLVKRRVEEREWCLGNIDDLVVLNTYYEIVQDNMPFFKTHKMGENR